MVNNDGISNVPSIKTTFISLGINILFCLTILPLALNPGGFTFLYLLEGIYWQATAAFYWPLTILMLIISTFQGFLEDLFPLEELLKILIYPAGWTLLGLTIFLKKGKWITLFLLHLLILISFLVIWDSIFSGYDFMID